MSDLEAASEPSADGPPLATPLADPIFGTLYASASRAKPAWVGLRRNPAGAGGRGFESEYLARFESDRHWAAPTNDQRIWLEETDRRIGLLWVCALPVLKGVLHHYLGSEPMRSMLEEFALTEIFVPREPARSDARWEAEFTALSDPSLRWTVMFSGQIKPGLTVRVRVDRP